MNILHFNILQNRARKALFLLVRKINNKSIKYFLLKKLIIFV